MKSAGGISTSDVCDMDDKFGDPQVLPRVGDQYQAEIPSLIAAPYLSQLTKKIRVSDMPESFSLGLPLPLMLARGKVQSRYGTLESVTIEERQVISENECAEINMESQTALLGEGQNVGGFSVLQSSFKFDGTVIDSDPERKADLDQLRGMSEGYCRWSKWRKLRVKIFKGWRQQELLSRLFSRVSGKCQTMLVELSRNFGEGKMPFEEYVFALKDAVGIDLLIAAVGIGKGKQDLTGTAFKPTKTNHIFTVRPEIPIGKACSSLTSADIIKFLTGDFRLSKARSSDLFWEAVWPRLLAKGWHSEQPKDYVVSGSKQSLVFLIPGVKKFSRKRLVKGNHYFDSISDVLNKVASEPGLLEMEIQATEGSVDRENRQDKQDLDGLLNKQQFCYLQTVSSKCQDLMQFAIVDTSIVYDLDQCKVRQMRSSPFQTMSTILSNSSRSELGTFQETEDQAEQPNTSNPVEEFSDKWMSIESSDCTHIPEALNATKEEEHSREINEYQLIENVTLDCSKYLTPIMKKQKLTACNHREFSQCAGSTLVDRKLDLKASIPPSYQHDASEGSPNISNDGSATRIHLAGEVSTEKPETRMLIDLNLPLISSELEIEREVPSSMDIIQNNDNQCENTYSSPSAITQLNEIQEFPDDHRQQQPIIVNHCQSTRKWPLTTKALEALEYRFTNSKRKRKNAESSDNTSNSQCLRVRSGTIISATCDNGIGNVMVDTSREGKYDPGI